MSSIEHFIITMPWYLQGLASVMAVLFLAFLFLFLVRGQLLRYTLAYTCKRLHGYPTGSSPDELADYFPKRGKLAHLWHEYQETLHGQRDNNAVNWRATGPAEAFFNSENIVDPYVGAEFFRHLPGLFTGMGIIGTFAGLIQGLSGFHPTTDPQQTMAMIGPLISAVREAFFVSAAAITAAMFITLLEKLTIAALYGRTAKLANAIDEIFDAGIDEEYLARLTKATEEGASQAKMLKDALVKDLGDILREVTQHQTDGIAAAQKELGNTLSSAIQQGLTEPLNRMEQSFKAVTGNTGERTVQMLNDVMASFSAKLNDLFGGQIKDINAANQHSAETMQAVANSLHELVEDLGRKGKESTDQMAQKMAEAISTMELRQSDINTRTEASLEKMAESMRALMGAMGSSVSHALADSQEREVALVQQSATVATNLGQQVDKAIAQMAQASQAMAGSVDKLSDSTTAAITKLNAGAEKVVLATSGLADTVTDVDNVIARTKALGQDLSTHSRQLVDASQAVQTVLSDYQEQRRAMQQLMMDVRATVEAARKEGAITEDVLARIEKSTQGLAQVHAEFEQYLAGINDVLGQSSDAFRKAVTSTLGDVNTQFHQQLSLAVNLLSDSIGELETTLSDMPRAARA